MKTLTLLVSALALFIATALVIAAPIQQKKGAHSSAKSSATSKVFVCDKCDVASLKAGACPECKAKLTPASATMAYGCPSCGTTAAKAGDCPKCKGDMQKVAVTYVCDHCHTTSAKAGKCTKCGMALKKEVLPLVKM